ncbi:hypothetical protein [Bacillus toyonensis]|uniref:hypothetical protein n=1 Tax=Bacillus toyonensis TaxID=155322 RepID=UPI0021D1ABA4|nr:hypothetical protein [Bacillus toyonensis]MCU4768257.1 hypothetical protein [Bacillus toyonensis]
MQTYIWNLGDASLTFHNGTMVPFQKGELATTTRDMMYFYYDVLLQVRQETRRILVRNHPTAHYIADAIHAMIHHPTKAEGYLLENTRSIPDYIRKVWYHQMEIADLFWQDMFIRLEKYQYEVKKSYEETVTETPEYKITIDSISTDSESNSNFVWYINGVTQEKLQELATVVQDFTEDTIQLYNHGVET